MATPENLLGKTTNYFDEYTPSVLFPIARNQGRSSLELVPFKGYDFWRIYELSFLAPNGLPQACMATLKVPCNSPYIIESKSLKLYLGSFCQTIFSSVDEVAKLIEHDLSDVLDCEVEVKVYLLTDAKTKDKDFKELKEVMGIKRFNSVLLEAEKAMSDVKFKSYDVDSSLLKLANNASKTSETVYTNLFRSLCPVTSQPDYASVEITYTGEQIDHASLLSYLVSFRKHQGFHEQCVERIFTDLKNVLKVEDLTVVACFTRRGGIDINPIRSNCKNFNLPLRTIRQ